MNNLTFAPVAWDEYLYWQTQDKKTLRRINQLGIGPAGIGGRCTALKVNIAAAPTHIAGMPAAVNMCCHAARHAHTVL